MSACVYVSHTNTAIIECYGVSNFQKGQFTQQTDLKVTGKSLFSFLPQSRQELHQKSAGFIISYFLWKMRGNHRIKKERLSFAHVLEDSVLA